jgi:NAD-dependent dihydropyrimidine dehydrogenase PreA subunit
MVATPAGNRRVGDFQNCIDIRSCTPICPTG